MGRAKKAVMSASPTLRHAWRSLALLASASALSATVPRTAAPPGIEVHGRPSSTLALPFPELKELVGGAGRARSVWDAVRAGEEPLDSDLVTIGARRALIACGATRFVPATLAETHVAKDGTTKLLVRLADGLAVEAVLIPHPTRPRTTLCVSSQVGCDRGCRFCATARMGLVRQLTADEILAQFAIAAKVARESDAMPPLTNIVFMGMGDAGRNVDHVKAAATSLVDGDKFRMARSKITISTVGPSPEAFAALADADGMLAWSIHAADEGLRRKLVPSSRHPLPELRRGLIDALEARPARRRTLMLAATLIRDVNDSDDDAAKLAEFIGPIVDAAGKCNVDLIPCNPTDHTDFESPSTERVLAYAAKIRELEPRVHVATRLQRGDDESAACGQLLVSRKPELVA